jgi:hypothetical protein
MTYVQAAAISVLVLSALMDAGHPAVAAPAKCNAEMRKCYSHCNLVYESSRANRTCRNRCKDNFYLCKAQPG